MQFGKNKPRFHGGQKESAMPAMSLTWYTHARGYEWDGNGRGGHRVAEGKGVSERERCLNATLPGTSHRETR